MEILYFTAGAVSLMVGIIIHPYLQQLKKWMKSFFIRKPKQQPKVYCDDLQSQVDDLKEQLDNVAERLAIRDKNRRYNTRREVRDYLAELRNDK